MQIFSLYRPLVSSRVLFLVATYYSLCFPGDSAVKNLPANAGDTGSIPGSGRSPGKGHATHSSILAWEIPWREAWWAIVHRVAKESDTT